MINQSSMINIKTSSEYGKDFRNRDIKNQKRFIAIFRIFTSIFKDSSISFLTLQEFCYELNKYSSIQEIL